DALRRTDGRGLGEDRLRERQRRGVRDVLSRRLSEGPAERLQRAHRDDTGPALVRYGDRALVRERDPSVRVQLWWNGAARSRGAVSQRSVRRIRLWPLRRRSPVLDEHLDPAGVHGPALSPSLRPGPDGVAPDLPGGLCQRYHSGPQDSLG